MHDGCVAAVGKASRFPAVRTRQLLTSAVVLQELMPQVNFSVQYMCVVRTVDVCFDWKVDPLTLCPHATHRRRDQLIVEKSVACSILKDFARCVLARYRLLRRANIVFRRVFDSDSSTYYYVNTRTGQSSWSKSAVYLNTMEPPIYVHVDDDKIQTHNSNSNNNFSTQRIHPLTSRVR